MSPWTLATLHKLLHKWKTCLMTSWKECAIWWKATKTCSNKCMRLRVWTCLINNSTWCRTWCLLKCSSTPRIWWSRIHKWHKTQWRTFKLHKDKDSNNPHRAHQLLQKQFPRLLRLQLLLKLLLHPQITTWWAWWVKWCLTPWSSRWCPTPIC